MPDESPPEPSSSACAFCEKPIDQPHPLGLCSRCDVNVRKDEQALDADPRMQRGSDRRVFIPNHPNLGGPVEEKP